MATVERHQASIEIEEAGSDLTRLIAELDEHPERIYSLRRNQEAVAILLNPKTFEQVLEAVQDVLDVQEAIHVLATEPLTSVHEYHERRMARRRAT